MNIPMLFLSSGIFSFFIAGSAFGFFAASAYSIKKWPTLWEFIKSSLLGGWFFGGTFLFLGCMLSYPDFVSSNLVIKIIMVILAILLFLLGISRAFKRYRWYFEEERVKKYW
jgi:hypothetical protein